ncbi:MULTISPECIES: CinA family protein [unclassified Aureimonas]|uniref:CinA family protein n=1 Tax=unclassified Aureimonas TaxID=2615206 RepID=UPI0006F93C54|nr:MULTISPECIES: CinA family protein [unclassified Aureimonas]KQT60340.1 damage-inducible protein CinA [Aureimonas sp. Leaf427]KQT79216.1 damage-inducible protein CinA [Aureimonas sp. Leaf460]
MTLPAAGLVERLRALSLRVTTVESCTGGLIAAAITDVAGSSAVFDMGFVTYSNAAKTALVGVPEDLLDRVGAVSREVACAMAEGGRLRSGADAAVAVTGIAGPGGGSGEKPVGLVHFALATAEGTRHEVRRFGDLGRSGVRAATVALALEILNDWAAQRAATEGAAAP